MPLSCNHGCSSTSLRLKVGVRDGVTSEHKCTWVLARMACSRWCQHQPCRWPCALPLRSGSTCSCRNYNLSLLRMPVSFLLLLQSCLCLHLHLRLRLTAKAFQQQCRKDGILPVSEETSAIPVPRTLTEGNLTCGSCIFEAAHTPMYLPGP
jgi:hypothetical protein